MSTMQISELRDGIDELLIGAHENGLEVDRTFELRHDQSAIPDWEIEITPLAAPSTNDV